jgi:hypothetical protein
MNVSTVILFGFKGFVVVVVVGTVIISDMIHVW